MLCTLAASKLPLAPTVGELAANIGVDSPDNLAAVRRSINGDFEHSQQGVWLKALGVWVP